MKEKHYPGKGCTCEARSYCYCVCENADWRSKREVELEENISIAMKAMMHAHHTGDTSLIFDALKKIGYV